MILPDPLIALTKFGERYEGRWTTRQLLYVLLGQVDSVTVEDVGEISLSAAFTLRCRDKVEVHQVKRQHGSAPEWKISALNENGVLGIIHRELCCSVVPRRNKDLPAPDRSSVTAAIPPGSRCLITAAVDQGPGFPFLACLPTDGNWSRLDRRGGILLTGMRAEGGNGGPGIAGARCSGVGRGAGRGYGAGDAVGAAYGRLKRLIADGFAGNKSAEVALDEHAADPDTWQAPLAKALDATGVSADESVLAAARQLMELLDAAGARAGKYDVDLRGGHGVQVGEGNQQVNIYAAAPGIIPPGGQAQIRAGQPRNEAAFGPVYETVGGAAFLGDALGEVYDDGPGFVQHFGGGPAGEPAVICALYEHVPVAVAQEVWDALRSVGRGAYGGGTNGVGFPVASQAGQLAFISAGASTVDLAGGKWGSGELIQIEGRWRWRPHVRFDSEAYQDQDTWSMRREEMDLRLRVAARIPFLAEGSRITGARRSRMLAALPDTGLISVIAGLATRYGLETRELNWEETPEPAGYNDTLRAAYQHTIAGPDGRAALRAALWFTLPHGYEACRAIVDLSIDFDAVRPGVSAGTPAHVPADLRIAPGEVAAFFSSAWQAAMALPLAGTENLLETLPAGPPRLEFYIQNRRPEHSGGQRTVRTLDMVDLSVFGRTRRLQLTDLAVGITGPLGLSAEETSALARQAMIRMAEDYAFTGAETAQI